MKKGIKKLNENLRNEFKRKLNQLNHEFKRNVKEIDPLSDDYSKLLIFYQQQTVSINFFQKRPKYVTILFLLKNPKNKNIIFIEKSKK